MQRKSYERRGGNREGMGLDWPQGVQNSYAVNGPTGIENMSGMVSREWGMYPERPQGELAQHGHTAMGNGHGMAKMS